MQVEKLSDASNFVILTNVSISGIFVESDSPKIILLTNFQ
jgi:hypothetical protein